MPSSGSPRQQRSGRPQSQGYRSGLTVGRVRGAWDLLSPAPVRGLSHPLILKGACGGGGMPSPGGPERSARRPRSRSYRRQSQAANPGHLTPPPALGPSAASTDTHCKAQLQNKTREEPASAAQLHPVTDSSSQPALQEQFCLLSLYAAMSPCQRLPRTVTGTLNWAADVPSLLTCAP